jgi:hypothetical protein
LEQGVDRSLPEFKLVSLDVRAKGPRHLHAKPDSLEPSLNSLGYVLTHLLGFFVQTRFACLTPSVAATKLKPAASRFALDVDTLLFQARGQFIELSLISDIDNLFVPGEPASDQGD